jgi:hypothetical protein
VCFCELLQTGCVWITEPDGYAWVSVQTCHTRADMCAAHNGRSQRVPPLGTCVFCAVKRVFFNYSVVWLLGVV